MHMQGGIAAQVLEQEKGISWGKKTPKNPNLWNLNKVCSLANSIVSMFISYFC